MLGAEDICFSDLESQSESSKVIYLIHRRDCVGYYRQTCTLVIWMLLQRSGELDVCRVQQKLRDLGAKTTWSGGSSSYIHQIQASWRVASRVSQKIQKSEFWNATYPSGFHRLDEPNMPNMHIWVHIWGAQYGQVGCPWKDLATCSSNALVLGQ